MANANKTPHPRPADCRIPIIIFLCVNFAVMTIAILANDVLKEEWLLKEIPEEVELIWTDSVSSLIMVEADAYFDLLFDAEPERTARLKQLKKHPVFINAVPWTGAVTGSSFIRINAWPSLLRRPVVEIAITDPAQATIVSEVFAQLQWRYQIVPDTCGMITPRVLATIINEAWFTFGEGVSTKEEIDTAMKLGTNYPMGPFEWGDKIGLKNVQQLLKALQRTDDRYAIAPALEEALQNK
jgi:3-hydroxybutyryl-CoA dehydrogenase